MKRECSKSHSKALDREMEMLVFGSGGLPLVVFPTSCGRFFDYEDRGMIEVLAAKIDSGSLQVFCVDSVDSESWYNKNVNPRHRVLRHMHYENYICSDVLNMIRQTNGSQTVAVTGCSFGGYHAVNLALRHPDLVNKCVPMGGAYDTKQFLDGYYDDNCYFNSPLDFFPNLTDPWYLKRYSEMKFILATGEQDICRGDNERLSAIMTGKQIPHELAIWGEGTGHDWPWWKKMLAQYFL